MEEKEETVNSYLQICRTPSTLNKALSKIVLTLTCPENAVRFEDEFRLVDILRGGGQVVARVEPGACALCGDPLRASENGLCSTCRKRELTPLHVRLASTTPPAHPSCPHSDG